MGILNFSLRLTSAPLRLFLAGTQRSPSRESPQVDIQTQVLKAVINPAVITQISAQASAKISIQTSAQISAQTSTSPQLELFTAKPVSSKPLPTLIDVLAQPLPQQITTVKPSAVASRLKIVRLFEPGISATCAGRMVISGHIADICAELDRMEKRGACKRKPVFVN